MQPGQGCHSFLMDDDTACLAADCAARLKPGTWEAVEALGLLAMATGDPAHLASARRIASTLRPGS